MTIANYQQILITDYLLLIIYVYVCDIFYYLLTVSISTWFCNLVNIHGM